jgi:hypothetical protein
MIISIKYIIGFLVIIYVPFLQKLVLLLLTICFLKDYHRILSLMLDFKYLQTFLIPNSLIICLSRHFGWIIVYVVLMRLSHLTNFLPNHGWYASSSSRNCKLFCVILIGLFLNLMFWLSYLLLLLRLILYFLLLLIISTAFYYLLSLHISRI